MIFVVKTSEYPSPPVYSQSSVAKTIIKGGKKEMEERRREGKRQWERGLWGSKGSLLEEGFAAPLLLA